MWRTHQNRVKEHEAPALAWGGRIPLDLNGRPVDGPLVGDVPSNEFLVARQRVAQSGFRT